MSVATSSTAGSSVVPAPTTSVDLTDDDLNGGGNGAAGSSSNGANGGAANGATTPGALVVDISDALSERDWVKFTVHTKTSLPNFNRGEMSVVRLHEEFLWLHDTLCDDPEYAGFVIPPAPPRPDFDASREKLRKLGDAEGKKETIS